DTKPKSGGGPGALPFVFGGFGVVALGVAGFFQLSATNHRDELYTTCGPSRSCDIGDKDAIEGKVTVARIALGVGVVSLGVAAVLFFTRRGAASARAPTTVIAF